MTADLRWIGKKRSMWHRIFGGSVFERYEQLKLQYWDDDLDEWIDVPFVEVG
jgi:hypothetical protein